MRPRYRVRLPEPKLSDPVLANNFTIPPDLSDVHTDFLVWELERREVLIRGKEERWTVCGKCRRFVRAAQLRYSCETKHLPPGGKPEWDIDPNMILSPTQKDRARARAKASRELQALRAQRKAMREEQERLVMEQERLAQERQRAEDARATLEQTRRLATGKRVYSVLNPRIRPSVKKSRPA
jgi:hypothetical protein